MSSKQSNDWFDDVKRCELVLAVDKLDLTFSLSIATENSKYRAVQLRRTHVLVLDK